MTYSQMLSNSSIVASKVYDKKKYKLSTKRGRITQILAFLVLSAYCVSTKFLFKEVKLDLVTGTLIVHLLSLLALAFINKSIFSKNHYQIYKALVLINKVCKLIIFIDTMTYFGAYYSPYFKELFATDSWIKELFNHLYADFKAGNYDWTINVFNTLYEKDKVMLISFFVNVIITVPVIFYLVITSLKYIPPFGIFTYGNWLISNSKYFYEYYEEDDTHFRRNKRRINIYRYTLNRFFIKVVISLVVAFILVFVGWCIYYY